MRTKNIKISMDIPVHFDKPDLNGVIYTKEAIINAVEKAIKLPITIVDNNIPIVVGVTNYIWLEDNGECGIIHVNGILRYGGTCESVVLNNNIVTNVELDGIGITK